MNICTSSSTIEFLCNRDSNISKYKRGENKQKKTDRNTNTLARSTELASEQRINMNGFVNSTSFAANAE